MRGKTKLASTGAVACQVLREEKMAKTPPFVTPFALVSLVLALGATNVVVNKTTHTNEGAKVTTTTTSTDSERQVTPSDRSTSDRPKDDRDASDDHSQADHSATAPSQADRTSTTSQTTTTTDHSAPTDDTTATSTSASQASSAATNNASTASSN